MGPVRELLPFLLALAGRAFVALPLIMWRLLGEDATPRYEPFDPSRHATPPEVGAFIRDNLAALAADGFTQAGDLVRDRGANITRVTLLEHPEGETATVAVVYSERGTAAQTSFASGGARTAPRDRDGGSGPASRGRGDGGGAGDAARGAAAGCDRGPARHATALGSEDRWLGDAARDDGVGRVPAGAGAARRATSGVGGARGLPRRDPRARAGHGARRHTPRRAGQRRRGARVGRPRRHPSGPCGGPVPSGGPRGARRPGVFSLPLRPQLPE